MASSKLLPAAVNDDGGVAVVGEPQAVAGDERAGPHQGEVHEQRHRDAGDVERVGGDLVALQGEQHDDGEEQSVEGDGSDAGQEGVLVPVGAFAGLADGAGQEPGEQWDAQEDEHRLGDGPHRHVEVCGVEAEPARQHRQVEPAEHAVRGDLEQRVEGHQDRGELAASTGQVVPDEDHGDAAGQADDDEAGAQLGQVGEEHPGEGEHQQRSDEPVEDERQADGAVVGQLVAEVAVADLGQDRVHHGEQPDGDRQRDGVDLDALERRVQVRDQPAQQQAGGHGQADPHRAGTGRGWRAWRSPSRCRWRSPCRSGRGRARR